MYEIIVKYYKKNYSMILATSASILGILYAVARFFIYVYWRGYFSAMSIDYHLLKIDYQGTLFYAGFIAIIGFIMCYFVFLVFDFLDRSIEEIKLQKGLLGKIARSFINLLKFFFYSFFQLLLVNCSLAFLLFIVKKQSLDSKYFLMILVIYVIEILWIVFIYIFPFLQDREKRKRFTQVQKLGIYIEESLLLCLFLVILTYVAGTKSFFLSHEVKITGDQKYAVIYSTETQYLLNSIIMEDEIITFDGLKQKAIDIDECEVTIVQVKEINLK